MSFRRASDRQPEAAELPARLHAVLEAIYAAYSLGREGTLAVGDSRDELRREAVYLSRLVATTLPLDAEALGFCALLEFCEARRPAQVGANDEFIPLLEQDPERWDLAMITTAYELLRRAAERSQIGPFQLEAAIAAAHCNRARTGVVPWSEIATLYGRLVDHYPTIGAAVGRAVAIAHVTNASDATGPARGLLLLETMTRDSVLTYQPWWVALGHVHELLGDAETARTCLVRALGLTIQPRLRRFLETKIARL